MEHYLSLTTLFKYLEATPNSRTFVEGEQVLNSRHLILVGVTDGKLNIEGAYSSIKIMALCLQTSALLTGKPHEISGWLEQDSCTDIWNIRPFTCSCKAGASGRCKHISATLQKCTRVDLQTLERLSGTDVECYWKSQKKHIQDEYKACPIRDLECTKIKSCSKRLRELSEVEEKRCTDLLIGNNAFSALNKHKKGRRTLHDSANGDSFASTPDWLQPIIDGIQESKFLRDLDINKHTHNLRDCCQLTYSSLCDVDFVDIMRSSFSGSESWKKHRKYRLTGSRCYSIFTYDKEDWKDKSLKYFYPKGFSNKFVQHGIMYEKEARDCYKSKLGHMVVETGFIICSRYPWLGFSPDGLIIQDGKPHKLLEIKCPFVGRIKDSSEFMDECKYLELTPTGLKLKENHSYYAQVQLGMGLLNLTGCDFIVYSSHSKSFLNVFVPFNEAFTGNLIKKISLNYFTHMLHVICENK